jgi:hypothetical protein
MPTREVATRSIARNSVSMLSLVLLCALAAGASGDIPKKVSYQGRLTDGTGQALPGSHSLVFRIYDDAVAGALLWSETKAEKADTSGVFSTLLGSVNPIELDFGTPCWLEVEADGEILLPRREIVSVPFAYRAAGASDADMLGGRPAEAFADSSVDGHSLDAADGDPEDALYVDQYGRVGVGTTTPATFLDVRALGSDEGGVDPYGEVVGHFKLTGSDAHSAISIDAQPGKDAILYFAQNGASMWDLRNDTDIGDKFQLRWHRGSTVRAVTVDSTGYVGIATTSPNGPLQVQSNISINSGTRLADRVAPLVVGDGDGANPCILIDGNQIEQADTSDLVYINYNSPARVSLAQGGGNVGIGTTTPGAKLEVAGQVKLTSGPSGSGLWLDSGYEGIGTSTPNGPLHVESSLNISSGTNLSDRKAPVVVGDGDGAAPCILIDGNQIEQSDTTNVLYLNLSSPARIAMAQGGGNVGIGTSSPDAKLEVAGQVKITGGSPGAGKVLASDAGGLASWQTMDVEYMLNPADNALARLSGSELAQGYYEGHYLIWANELPMTASLAIPVHLQSRVGGVTQRIKSLKVYYKAGTGSRIDTTRIKVMDNAGGDIAVIDDGTDRTSTSWTSYIVTDPSPDPITGVVTVWLGIEFESSSSLLLQSIILTTGP